MPYKVLKINDVYECNIISRPNKFIVRVLMGNKIVNAYVANTGRLSKYLSKGIKAYCVKVKRKYGKTELDLLAVEDKGLGAIISVRYQNLVFEKSLNNGLIPWLKGCKIIKRNVKLGNSLIDYLIKCYKKEIYVETKSAVMRGNNHYAMYPDCPTLRGRQHIKILTDLSLESKICILLFIAAIPYVKAFQPNKFSDPKLYKALLKAIEAGVLIKSISMYYNPSDSTIYLDNPNLRIVL